ncbi:MAG: RNA-binding protein [Bryobacterales bacterium]
MRTLFVANLGKQTTEDQVRMAFETHGEVDSVQIAHDPGSGVSRGVAFVKMLDAKLASAMAKSMTGAVIEGRSIRVSLLSRTN